MPFLSLNELVLTLTLGAALGFFGGLFGIGGGIIAIPLLVLGFGMEQPLAQGTALVMMVPNLLIAWWRYSRRHPAGWRPALVIGLSGTLTTWLLAHFSTLLDPKILRWMFSGFITMLALRMLLARHRTVPLRDETRPTMTALPLLVQWAAVAWACWALAAVWSLRLCCPAGWGYARRWRRVCRWPWWHRVRSSR